MRAIAYLVACTSLAMSCAFAQSETETARESTSEAQEARADVPIPPKLQPPEDEGIPQVSIRTQDNGDRVEEYRQNGRLTMVKVIPQRGAPYFLLDTNGDGRLDTKDGEGSVAPVYWTIYEWD